MVVSVDNNNNNSKLKPKQFLFCEISLAIFVLIHFGFLVWCKLVISWKKNFFINYNSKSKKLLLLQKKAFHKHKNDNKNLI